MIGFDFLLVQLPAFIEKKKPRLRRYTWQAILIDGKISEIDIKKVLPGCIPLKSPPCENIQAAFYSPLPGKTKADFPPYLLHKKATAGKQSPF